MNTELEAATVHYHEIEGSQRTAAAHATPIEGIRIHEPCVARAVVCAPDPCMQDRNAKMEGFQGGHTPC